MQSSGQLPDATNIDYALLSCERPYQLRTTSCGNGLALMPQIVLLVASSLGSPRSSHKMLHVQGALQDEKEGCH